AFASHKGEIHIIKTIAQVGQGIQELIDAIKVHNNTSIFNEKKYWLLTEKAYQLIQKERMKDVNKLMMKQRIEEESKKASFHLYRFIHDWL
ncbi:MAG TPA: methylmalonyl Co-A mutase-associated GTPase MeaB, partial [Flavisolibacter sp.]|nr:methylmalonyl Co-A mutase-associated GTPase MeaB [Flavisolibacter sp.]